MIESSDEITESGKCCSFLASPRQPLTRICCLRTFSEAVCYLYGRPAPIKPAPQTRPDFKHLPKKWSSGRTASQPRPSRVCRFIKSTILDPLSTRTSQYRDQLDCTFLQRPTFDLSTRTSQYRDRLGCTFLQRPPFNPSLYTAPRDTSGSTPVSGCDPNCGEHCRGMGQCRPSLLDAITGPLRPADPLPSPSPEHVPFVHRVEGTYYWGIHLPLVSTINSCRRPQY